MEPIPRNCNKRTYWVATGEDEKGKIRGRMGEGSVVDRKTLVELMEISPPFKDSFVGNGKMDAYLTVEYSC